VDGGAGASDDAWGAQVELWAWARRYCDERIGQYAMEETNQEYTAEERAMGVENVRTGLRRAGAGAGDENAEEDEDGFGGESGAARARGPAESVPEEVRRVARLKLVRNSVVGRYELPPNADWEAKRRLGMAARGPARGPPR
jgi:mediator of RNA polymerase II transcription subunit 8